MLGAFRDFLIERAVVRENHVPYYIKWLAACYAEIGEPNDEIVSTGEKAGFLGRMSANHQDWQVAQADDALRLYEYFLTSQRNVVADPKCDANDVWVSLETHARRTLRVRQRALSTEKLIFIGFALFENFSMVRIRQTLRPRTYNAF